MNFTHLKETISAYSGGIQNFLVLVAVILAAIAAGLCLQKIIWHLLSRWRKSHISIEMQSNIALQNRQRSLRMLLSGLLLMLFIPLLQLPAGVMSIMQQAIWIWVIASFAWLAIDILDVCKQLVLSRYRIDEKDNLQARRMYTQLGVIERILKVLVIFIALTFILLTFERVRQIGFSLLASAGILSVILGFSAQKSLATLFAGIQIALTQPIRIDDVVIVEGEWGWIEEITLTYVVVKIWDQRRLVVPISYFIEKPFQNWTRTNAEMLGTVYIFADYTLPVQELRQELQRILADTPLWDQRVGVLQVTGAGERTLELRALISAEDSPTVWSLRCYVREKLIEFLQNNFPQSLPHLRVNLAKEDSK